MRNKKFGAKVLLFGDVSYTKWVQNGYKMGTKWVQME